MLDVVGWANTTRIFSYNWISVLIHSVWWKDIIVGVTLLLQTAVSLFTVVISHLVGQRTVVSYQSERFSSKWELPSLFSPFFITRGRMGARRAALILMKISLWKDTTVPTKTAQIFSKYRPKSSHLHLPNTFQNVVSADPSTFFVYQILGP